MANVIKPFPRTSNGDPEVLPWATGGTTLEPTTGQESNGWQPQAVAGPPDYRLENYARLKQSQLNDRGVQSALFLERCQAQITLAGYNAGVNQRRITINGTTFDVTDGGGSVNVVRDSFVSAINSSGAISPLVTASAGGAGILYVTDNTPGNSYSAAPSLAVSVLAGAGTITISSAGTTPIVREDDDGLLADMVIGSTQANADANANHHNRIIWRKAKGSFRAGRFTGTEADLANTGNNSVALGNGATASGADAHAYGLNASASGLSATAVGPSTIASGITSTALGFGAEAVDVNALAMQGGIASANGAVAIGSGSTANAGGALSMMGGTASGTGSIALGNGVASALSSFAVQNTTASGTGSVSMGNASVASGNYALAVGNSAEATANYAVAIGNNPTSSKLNSVALGVNTQANNTGEVCYSGTDLGAANGRSQWGVIHMWGECNGGASIELKPDGQADSFFPDEKGFYLFEIKGVGIQTSNQANYATFEHTFGAYKAGGAVTIQFGTGVVIRTNSNYNLTMSVGAPGGQIVITGNASAVANPSRFAVQLRYIMITSV